MAETLGPRQVVVARELTKLHEEALTGEAGALAQSIGKLKGEITLLIAPPESAGEISDEQIDEALKAALSDLPAGKAAAHVAKALGLSRQTLYDRAVALKSQAQKE